MTDEIKIKIAKVYELVRRGEQGEQQAAEKALQRLLGKYNLSEEEVAKFHLKEYVFKYVSDLDKRLFRQLFEYFFKDKYNGKLYICTWRVKEISVEMEYLDYIQIECSYEYFKRHMNQQWRKFALPLIKQCRTLKSKNKRRQELQNAFFSRYIIKSGIYHQYQVRDVYLTNRREMENLMLFSDIEGGMLKGQVTTGLYLDS